MSMKELLRVALDAKDIRQACADWARVRVAEGERPHEFKASGIADDAACTVIVSNKRDRKPKAKP